VIGSNLGSVTAIRFSHPRLTSPTELTPDVLSPNECRVQLPDAQEAAAWPAGFYQVQAVTQRNPAPRLVSAAVPMGLGPVITVTSPTAPVPAGTVTVRVECTPPVGDGQTVAMMLGSAPAGEVIVENPPGPAPHSLLTAEFKKVLAGTYTVRARVDRADSDPVLYTGSPPVPQFDPAVQVVVT
jgi:hypothetical protein